MLKNPLFFKTRAQYMLEVHLHVLYVRSNGTKKALRVSDQRGKQMRLVNALGGSLGCRRCCRAFFFVGFVADTGATASACTTGSGALDSWTSALLAPTMAHGHLAQRSHVRGPLPRPHEARPRHVHLRQRAWDRYEGEWSGGKKHGRGTYTFLDAMASCATMSGRTWMVASRPGSKNS